MISIEPHQKFYIEEIPRDADYIAPINFHKLPDLDKNIYKLDDRWTHFDETGIPSYIDEFFEITDIHENKKDYEWVCGFSIFFLKEGGPIPNRVDPSRHDEFIDTVEKLATYPDKADNVLLRFYVSPEAWERLHKRGYFQLPDTEFCKMRFPSEDSQIGCVWRMLALSDRRFEWAIQTECEDEAWCKARIAYWDQDKIKKWLTSNNANFALGSEILIDSNYWNITMKKNISWGEFSCEGPNGIALWHHLDLARLDYLSSGGITTRPERMPDARQILHRYIAQRPIQHVMYHQSENRWTSVTGHRHKIEYGWRGWGCGQSLWAFVKKAIPTRHLLFEDSIRFIEQAEIPSDSAMYRLFSQLMAEGSEFTNIDTHEPIFEVKEASHLMNISFRRKKKPLLNLG